METYDTVIVVVHEMAIKQSIYGDRLQKLLESNNVKVKVYTESDYIRDPFHSINLKKANGYSCFIINITLKNAGKSFRSDVTVNIEDYKTYMLLLKTIRQIFKVIYNVYIPFIDNEIVSLQNQDRQIEISNMSHKQTPILFYEQIKKDEYSENFI